MSEVFAYETSMFVVEWNDVEIARFEVKEEADTLVHAVKLAIEAERRKTDDT